MNTTSTSTVLALGLLLAAAPCASAQAGPTLTVPTDHPTIQAAIAAAPSQATILVLPGTYSEVLDLQGKEVQLRSVAGPSLTVIDGAAGNDAVITANSGETLATCVSGFTLRGGAGKPFASSYGFDHYGGGVYVGGASSLRVEDCWILENGIGTGTFAGGVFAGGAGSHAEVRGCLIADNFAWASGGATLVDGDATMHLEHCTVTGNSANSWSFGHQGGVSMANGGDVTLSGCIVWGNAGFQIRAFGGVYSSGTSAICNYGCVQGGFAGVGNIGSNPLFVSEATGNFQLQSSSPCIDAGDPAATLDPDGTRADMGCFAFDQGLQVVATATVFGAGCGAPALALTPVDAPVAGTLGSAVVTNAPSTVGGVAIGWNNTTLGGLPVFPLSLAYLGMPGCDLLHSNDLFGLPVTSSTSGTLDFAYAVPTAPGLLGQHVYLQAYCYAPGANPLEVIVSNGVDWLIGNQ
ncbi:MAG: hypothetical protein CMJ88_06640 [Planctomycetes bacterium]|nr:hypothetical protein [Planctomycetota bacterium]